MSGVSCDKGFLRARLAARAHSRRGLQPALDERAAAEKANLEATARAARYQFLVETAKVASVPGSSFFSRPELGAHLVRFAFPKRIETLEESGRRLRVAAGRA